MKRLINWFTILIKRRKELKRWQRIVTVLAAMITFATTYALILPAITVERDRTEEVAGMYLEQEENRNDLLEENALEFTGVSIAADQENAVTYEYSDDGMTAVATFSTEEEIPEGAELVVNPVDTESEKYTELSNRAALLLGREFIYDVTTCSFYDFALICDGVDVTPKTGLVDVQISFLNNTVEHVEDVVFAGRFGRSIDKSSGFVTMSANDMDEVGAAVEAVDTQGADDDLAGSGNQVDVNDELISANPDESPVIELTDSIITTLSLKGNDLSQTDSVVGILAGHVDEEAKAAAVETDAEIPSVDDIQEDASAPEVKTLKAAGKDYTVTLTYDETSEIPEGASLSVSEIAQDTKEYKTYLEKTKKAMGLTEEENLPRFAARFFDIKIMVGDNEFKPESGVSVEITYAEPLAENPETEVSAVHFADKKAKAEVIVANTSEVQDDGAATVEFTAESFSVYGVIYTVDFHWEVDGKTYEYSLAGGDSVSFRELLKLLHVIGTADDAQENGEQENGSWLDKITGFFKNNEEQDAGAEEFDQFINDISSVRFSDESLVKVAPITEETTAGALKDQLGLECEYSAELSDAQRRTMDSKTFYPTDWALISLKAFTTEEYLTVEMKNGEKFRIRVTDAQIKKTVIDAKGDTWEITVTYGEDAQIPDGAELKVEEILPQDDRYQMYFDKAMSTASGLNPDTTVVDEKENEDIPGMSPEASADNENTSDADTTEDDYARFFDISIWDDKEEIKPQAAVLVNIKLLDAPEEENHCPAVVHFGSSGPEVMELKEQEEKEADEGLTFATDSFSIYGVIYTVDFHWEVDGKVYEISIPGGGFLSFEKLVEILEIAKTDKEAESGNNQRAKSESDAAEETENSDEMAENNEASESTEDIEPDKETENTDKTVSASDDSQINEISDELSKKDIFLLALKDVRVSEETKEFVAKVDHIEFSNPELLWVDKVEKECTVSELKENNNLEVQYSDELTEEQIDEINAQTVETGDWALISLQQFYTEETLTVTMTNGKTWTIRVTDAVAENPVRNPGTVNTVDTYADGVKMWLFNYDTDGNLDDSSNKIKFNGTDHTGKVGFNNNTLASDGINGYSGLKFLGWGSDSDYNITSNVDINNFTGLDESGQGKGNKIKALQGIVQNSLDENGYPVLNSQYSSTSLDYLFDPTANTNDRVVYGGENGNVTNLFRKENGYYKFDSNQHYAQFDGDHTFTVYDTTIPQTDKNGNKHNPTRAVGFFPFNSYNNMLGIWDTNQNQNGSHTLYLNPDRDTSKTDRAGVKDLDHHFGVMLEAKFVLPADGKDENGNPIRFDFSGDDDMWVFIDDELVLDIGGIHQPVSGTIDFQNGKAYVVGDHTVAGHSDNTGTNAVATAYGAGVTRNSTGDGNYYFYNDDSVGKKIQLGDGKVHTMKIFYIERGGCDSNCEITFNLPTVKTGNLDLKKVWGDVERRAEEVYYTITANYKEASDANKRDLAKFFSSMTEKQLTQYGLTKDNIKQIDANNDGVLDTNDPYVFVVKGSDWELKIKQLRICQDSLQNGNLTHDQIPLTYTVLERYALVDGKIVDATDQYSQAVEKSGAQLPSTSDIILGENDVSLWQDITGNNATFKVTNEPGMNVTVNKDWAQDCDPLSDTTITGVVKRYKLVDKGNTLTIQSVLEDTDNSGIDFSGVTYTIMKNGQQVGDPISFAEAQAGKNLELPDSGPYTVVENNVPGTPQGYSVVHNPQNQQHNVTLDPNGNTTVTFTTTYKQVNKPSNSTYLIRDYYYYNYQGGKDLNSGNIEFPVGARVTMKFKCRNGYWSSRDMKAEYNGERINITASPKDYNQNLEFTVGPFTVVENGRLVVDVNTNGNSNNDGFVSGSVNFTQVRSLHSNLRAMRMPLKAAPQKTDLTFSQELNETTLASLPAAPEGKHYVLDNWSKEVNLDAASDWTKTVAVEVGNNYGDYYYFLASVTEHNVTQDTQGTIATNNDGSIRFAHKHADSNLPFEIENKRAKGALKITKNVTYNNGTIGDIPEGKESLVDKEFKFTVTKDGTQIEGSPFSITITNGASQILTIPDLEMGNYVITETDSKGLELTAYTGGISQDSTTKSVTVTVTARDNTAAQPTAQAFFTNNYSETDIIVKKVDQDKAAANPEDAERFIAGAKFSLLDGDERAVTGYKVINLKTNQEVVLEDNKFVVPLEGVKITGLLNGSYVLKEQEAPAGYIITNNTTAFTVADGQVTAGGNGLTFEIPNPPGAALPNTGGPGTNKIYLLGIMLSGIAGAGLVMRKRRRAA